MALVSTGVAKTPLGTMQSVSLKPAGGLDEFLRGGAI